MAAAWLETLAHDQFARAMLGIEHAIELSFQADRGRVTQAEIRRRFTICERLFRQLRGDLGWGLHRVLDHLPGYLQCELDGVPWEPDRRTLWMPEDGP